MSVRRPPPGVQVSSGRVRVDAAKAIAKLRAYRLADPTAWILEAIRAAVASGATKIALDGDSDDLWLRWEGPAWAAAELAELFDELVSPEPAHGAYHRRLLAAAVNSGLGLAPAWIDVIAVDGAAAHRVRYTPEAIADGAEGEAALGRLAAEPVARPEGVEISGVVLHARRPFGLGVVSRFVRGAELPELALARRMCADIAVPMTVGGVAVGREHDRGDVMREPLGEGLDGWVALLDPDVAGGGPAAELHVAELGVRICTEHWFPGVILEGAPALSGAMMWRRPLRVVVDARRMATNASRSQVDPAQHPISTALRAAWPASQRLLTRLAAEELTPPRREAALALLASLAGGLGWAHALASLKDPLAPIAALPLLRNAVGAWRPVSAPWAAPIHSDASPVSADLAPWLDTMAWMPPDDAARRLLGADTLAALDRPAARRHIKAARKRRAALTRFLQHPQRPATVTPRAGSAAHYRFGHVVPNDHSAHPNDHSDHPNAAANARASCVPDAVFEGLRGEVCVMASATPGRVTLLLDGRPLDVLPLEGALSIDAVIDGAALAPDETYRRAEDDAELVRAVEAAQGAAIRAVEALLRGGAGGGATDRAGGVLRAGTAPSAELVRGAIVMAWRHDEVAFDGASPLFEAAVWPTVGGGMVSIEALAQERAVGVGAPQDDLVAPHGRTVVVAGGLAREALIAALEPGTAVVSYGGEAARPPVDPGLALGRLLLGRTRAATLVIREAGRSGAITFGDAGLTLTHRGVKVTELGRQPALFPCSIAVDCDAMIPERTWTSVKDDGGAGADLESWERALLHATARALLGEHVPDLLLPGRTVLPDDASGHALFAAIAANLLDVIGVDLAARICQLPMFRVVGRAERVSIAELRDLHPGDTIPAVAWEEQALGAEALDDYAPLIAGDAVRALVRRLSGRDIVDGEPELRRRRAVSDLESRLAHHRTRQTDAVVLPDSAYAIATPALARSRVGLAAPGATGIEVQVSLEGRRFSRVVSSPDLPLAATVEIDVGDLRHDLSQLTDQARTRLVTAVRDAAGPLLMSLALTRPAALVDDLAAWQLLAAWLTSDAGRVRGPVHEALRSAPIWPTLSNDRISLTHAARGPIIPVIRADNWTRAVRAADRSAIDARAETASHPSRERASTIAIPEGPEGDDWIVIIDAIGPWPVDDVTPTVILAPGAPSATETETATATATATATVPPTATATATETATGAQIGDAGGDLTANPRTWPWWTPAAAAAPERQQAGLPGLPLPWSAESHMPDPPAIPPMPAKPRTLVPMTPMRQLANALRGRLAALASAGVFIERVEVADVPRPIVVARGNDLTLAGEAESLNDLAAALMEQHPAADAGLDALAAHALTVLNAAHETVTDDVERAGLGHLLARPGQG